MHGQGHNHVLFMARLEHSLAVGLGRLGSSELTVKFKHVKMLFISLFNTARVRFTNSPNLGRGIENDWSMPTSSQVEAELRLDALENTWTGVTR